MADIGAILGIFIQNKYPIAPGLATKCYKDIIYGCKQDEGHVKRHKNAPSVLRKADAIAAPFSS